MNGGAELYFSFNVKRLAVRTFSGPDNVDMVVELYLFKNDYDAFGMFSMLPVDESLDLGDGGSFSLGVLRLWKGPYYCKIFLTGDYERHNQALKLASKIVDEKIDAHGLPPKLITVMPEKDRKLEGLHFFHDFIAQRNLYYISASNLFGLTLKTDVVMGDFLTMKAEEACLFLIEYPDTVHVEKIFQQAAAQLFGESVETGSGSVPAAQISDGRWCAMSPMGEFLMVGFSPNDDRFLTKKMAGLKQNLAEYRGN